MAKLSELDVHMVLEEDREYLANLLGIKIKGEVEHHYPVEGREIDFVLIDVSDRHWIIEVKLGEEPISAVGQVLRYEKLYRKKHPTISHSDLIPTLLVDTESLDEEERATIEKHGVRVQTYKMEEIQDRLTSINAGTTLPVPLDFEEISRFGPAATEVKAVLENFSDMQIVLEGIRAHYLSRDFWQWKQGKDLLWWPELIFNLQKKGQIEDALWVTFLEAITDDLVVAEAIFNDGYNWKKLTSSTKKQLIEYLDGTDYSLTKIIVRKGMTKGEILADTIFDYIALVKESQVNFFNKLIQTAKSQYEAYDKIIDTLKNNITGVGSWVARAFTTWISNRRLLPITPSEKVRISRPIRKMLQHLNLTKKRPSKKKTEQIILNLAAKYRVAPEFVMRGLFTMGYHYSD